MQANARGTYESGGKVPGERRGMQGNAMERMGGCKVPGECRECREMPEQRMGVGLNCQRNAVNAGECQGYVWEWVYSARGMQGTTRGMQGSGCKVLAE